MELHEVSRRSLGSSRAPLAPTDTPAKIEDDIAAVL
jgi:hypothetical protein